MAPEDYNMVMDLMASLWEETCEDGANYREYSPSVKDLWVEFLDGDKSIGAIRLRQWNGVTLQMCVNIRKECRKDYAKYVPSAIHKWIKGNVDSKFKKVVAFIPSYFGNVLAFAKGAGWDEEGIMQKAFQKNGDLHNIHVFGKKIEEMRA